MELLKLSKFKLQLQALAIEVGGLREREQSATEQCRILIQKQKQTDEEYRRQLQELQSELASSNELHQKLQRKVSYLQNDNALLEGKHKDLKGTIQSLLQSKESFVNSYQESTCEMKRSIEAGDRKLIVLSEKINSHLSLFDSIEREALSIKQLVDKVQLLVSEKEGFLMLYNQALHCEVGGLAIILQRIQETVVNMNEEDRRLFSSLLECQGDCDMVVTKEDTDRIEDLVQNSGEPSPNKASSTGTGENRGIIWAWILTEDLTSGEDKLNLLVGGIIQMETSCKGTIALTPAWQRQVFVRKSIILWTSTEVKQQHNFFFMIKLWQLTCSPLQSPCSELHSAANGPSISMEETWLGSL
ncbi:hypothetical protein POTOM_030491 [Populus tomentosa]|uniref:Uncharacterized protein n=1 Tax=Populus tomentosa TaxID=118781 RepID=A0A8X7ZAW7_POPTO|nr:hypothetical protein POTOM_030491 [Populus tomentosa]